MVDQQDCAPCHFGYPPQSIDDLCLLSALLECVVFNIVELETAHDEAVDGVDNKKPSLSGLFHPFQALFDEGIALIEVTALLIHEGFLSLLKLSLIHVLVGDACVAVPAHFLLSRQVAARDVPRHCLRKVILTPRANSIAS